MIKLNYERKCFIKEWGSSSNQCLHQFEEHLSCNRKGADYFTRNYSQTVLEGKKAVTVLNVTRSNQCTWKSSSYHNPEKRSKPISSNHSSLLTPHIPLGFLSFLNINFKILGHVLICWMNLWCRCWLKLLEQMSAGVSVNIYMFGILKSSFYFKSDF